MSGTFAITVQEARGFTAVPANIDNLAVVMGCSSAGSGLSSFFVSGSEAIASVGYGDAPDTLCQAIEQVLPNSNGVKFPVAFCDVDIGTAGSYGTIDVSGVVGTALVTNDTSAAPYGTRHPAVKIVDDGNDGAGGVLGTAGILYQTSQDNGVNWSRTRALGTGYSISVPNSNSGFILGAPASQVTAFIAAAVEARADTLGHLADVTAHDGADTSAAQIALAASSVPATAAAAWAVLNLCRTALASHESNITVHNGSDIVNVVSHAAATSTQTGIELFAEYRTDFNAHLAIALVAAVAGLRVATATVAAEVVLTSADLLDAGEALMATYPRRLTITTAGVTPANAPANAVIVGVLGDGTIGGETLVIAQTAAMVTSVNDYRSFTTITTPIADGTAATLAYGYAMGVHNSADVTNTIAATAPTHGTLITGDTWKVRTLGPVPGSADIDAAFEVMRTASADFRLLICDWPMTAALAAHVSTGLTALRTRGKRVTAIFRSRVPDFETGETEAAWSASIAAEFASFEDSHMIWRAGYGLVTDAMTGNQYLRANLQQFAADVVRSPRAQWPCAPSDPVTGLGGEPNVSLVDADGLTVGHDEGAGGTGVGLSNDTLGNRASCEMRIPESTVRESVFNTVPWTMYAADERIRNLMTRRIANAMAGVAVTAGLLSLGAHAFYTRLTPTTGTLKPESRKALQGAIYAAVSGEFKDEIDNAGDAAIDTGLVQVAAGVTISGGNLLAIAVTLKPSVGGYVLTLNITIAIQE